MNIDDISVEEIKKCFSECKTNSEVIRYFGRKVNGSGYRFLCAIREKAGINWHDYFSPTTKESYDANKKHCLTCGKELTYNQRANKFCSSRCAAIYNNIARGERSPETKAKISLSLRNLPLNENDINEYVSTHKREKHDKCPICGKEKNNVFTMYCSNKCYIEARKKEKIERWLNGENFVNGANLIPIFIREYLFKIHDSKCEICGWGEVNEHTGLVPLQIHHIDGDCTNNNIENLQLLCPNCHSLTDTFGSLNKNSKRFHRNKISKKDL